jgi:hypothetical protein
MKKDTRTLTRLTELIEAHNVFVRERKPLWVRSLGIALLYFGLSCRQTAEVLQRVDAASYEAARQWYHRAKALLREPSKRHRSVIAIDRRDQGQSGKTVVLSLGGGRHGEERAAGHSAHADARRARCLSRYTTRAPHVHEHADGGGRWRPVVRVGVEH